MIDALIYSVIAGTLLLAGVGYVINALKFASLMMDREECQDYPPNRLVFRAIGIALPPVGAIIGYLE